MWCATVYLPYVYTRFHHVTISYYWFGWKVRSVTAQCYVSMLDSSRVLSQRLFGDQCCWKNFSLWRKQTAHWLCSLLSGCINRPLTTLPPPFLIALWNCPHSNKFFIGLQEDTRKYTVTPKLPPFLCLSCILTNKHVLHIEWHGPVKLYLTSVSCSANNTGRGNPI